MNYKLRKAKLNDIDGKSTITCTMTVEAGYPLFIMDNDDVSKFIYNDKTVAKVANPTNLLKDAEYEEENGVERYTIGCTVESPINSDTVSIYYDAKYNNVLIVPNTKYASTLMPTSAHDISVYELATGSKVSKVNDTFPTYPTNEVNRQLFPKLGNLNSARSIMLSIPGIMPTATTQDANTFEEMINNSINLKRSQRIMLNIIELGTLKEVFPNRDGYTVPLYQCYQFAPCQYRIRHLCNVSSNNNRYDNYKVYVNMKF